MKNLKSIARKAMTVVAVATVLGASVVPAQANSNFGFSFNFGNQGGYNGGYVPPRPPVQRCMPNHRIENRLYNQGYSAVQFLREPYPGFPRFSAQYGGWQYRLQVNRCSGEIQVLHRAPLQRRHFAPRPFGGSFSIQFN